MSVTNAQNRNSTPEVSGSLRPPHVRSLGAGHHLRSSADMGGFSSPLAHRGIRPSSEVYFNRAKTASGNPDEMEKIAQQWLADIDQSEATLEEMATATLDQDFKDELSAIEQWFRVLCEAERTAALYALLQQTTQVQIRFFIQVLQQMSKDLPMSGVLSPANFGEKGPIRSTHGRRAPLTVPDPMTQKLSDAMSKLGDGVRNSFPMGRPPPSPGAKRNSGLDTTTIKRMFPDAAAAIAKQRARVHRKHGYGCNIEPEQYHYCWRPLLAGGTDHLGPRRRQPERRCANAVAMERRPERFTPQVLFWSAPAHGPLLAAPALGRAAFSPPAARVRRKQCAEHYAECSGSERTGNAHHIAWVPSWAAAGLRS